MAEQFPAFRVIDAGLLTTVQDEGRSGYARFGVSPGGALDRTAFRMGNVLLGNRPGDACLEITLIGPRLAVLHETVIAITGADLGQQINGRRAPLGRPMLVHPGDDLRWVPAPGQRGARAYLCVAGGIAVDRVMGSRSTDLVGAFGGFGGRPLRAGDLVPVFEPELPLTEISQRRWSSTWTGHSDGPIRVVLGPQADRFTNEGIAAFLEGAYRVTSRSNRQGIRLDGPRITHQSGPDLVSEGIAHGAIQVPGDGQPIILLAARQTVGGYTKIATVIQADLDRLAQLRPGDAVRFEKVSVEQAREAHRVFRERFAKVTGTDDDHEVVDRVRALCLGIQASDRPMKVTYRDERRRIRIWKDG